VISAVRSSRPLAALAAAALAGCALPGFDHVQLAAVVDGMDSAPLAVPVVLQEGSVTKIVATPMSSKGPLGGDFTFDLTSDDTSVLGVEPALGQPPGTAQFILFGVAPGSTQIDVTVNGQSEAPIPAQVTPQ
jgi:hypothetical protein